MNIEIYLEDKQLDIKNVIMKDYRKELSDKMELLSNTNLDFSSITKLKGDKSILNMSFLQIKEEELNP